ncbi:hypothetical protein L3V82_12250 [Thiotrichales bacterium 19S3-7]|nr:hypothetical protein [Thiotrichales bacterium 19S3-7]MCF6802961.1 hypothetical protein [Thiotrichales bacterium 19S3-11]
MRFNKRTNYLLSASLFMACLSTVYAGNDFASLLQKPSECSSTSKCPSGVYFVNQDNYSNATEAAQALYQLGTTIGGSQDGTISGPATQWSKDRYAILIGNGQYNMVNPKTKWPQPFKLGYYTEVIGVSLDRDDVIISPGINSLNDCNESFPWQQLPATCMTIGGLNNFWRGLGNLRIDASQLLNPENTANPSGSKPAAAASLRFAISQAAPIRNVHFEGKSVLLCDWDTGAGCGFTSGGFISDSHFSDNLLAGSQQQFYVSNSTFSQWQAGTWNMVSVNNDGTLKPTGIDTNAKTKTYNPWASDGSSVGYPFTNVTNSVVIPNKPRVVYSDDTWGVFIGDHAKTIKPISEFIIIQSNSQLTKSEISTINTQLSQTNNAGLIFMPGIYILPDVINVPANKIILGLGIPSLQCNSSSGTCMKLASEGIRLAGLVFDAGTNNQGSLSKENTLLIVGDKGSGSESSPVILQDIFCRVARTNPTMSSPSAYSCLTVNANYAIGQNLWLWRADHDDQSGTDPNPEKNLVPATIDKAQYGLIVNGDHVTMDALFVEHFQNYQTVWNGKNGYINFYQSEMPYLLPEGDSQKANVTCANPDGSNAQVKSVCPSILITKNAHGFTGQGLGIYSYFPKQQIIADSAIEIQAGVNNVTIKHAVIRWLNGQVNSGIKSIIMDPKGTYPSDSQVNGKKQGYAIDTHTYNSD